MPRYLDDCFELSPPLDGNDESSEVKRINNIIWKVTQKKTEDLQRKIEIECTPTQKCDYWEYDIAVICGKIVKYEIKYVSSQETKYDVTDEAVRNTRFTNYKNIHAFLINDNVDGVAIVINVFQTYDFQPEMLFNAPVENISDMKLKVEGQTLYVCKKILAQQSLFFYDLFYGDEESANIEEYEIKEATCNSFRIFLGMIYNQQNMITMKNWLSIAELSSRFMAEQCLEECEKYLIRADLHSATKLKYAQGFDFDVLHDDVMHGFKTVKEVLDLEKSEFFKSFGSKTRDAMLDRIVLIHRKEVTKLLNIWLRGDDTETVGNLKFPIKLTHNHSEFEDLTIECIGFDTAQLKEVKGTVKLYADYKIREFEENQKEEFVLSLENPKYKFISKKKYDRWLRTEVIIRSVTSVFPTRSTSFSEVRPNLTDIVLLVGDKRFHVSKQILANSSSYFYTMFFGSFNENGKNEIELRDIDSREFETFLQLIYHPSRKIAIDDIDFLMKFSDMYDVPFIVRVIETFVKYGSGMDNVKKILLAEKHNLSWLLTEVVTSIQTNEQFEAVCQLEGIREIEPATIERIRQNIRDVARRE